MVLDVRTDRRELSKSETIEREDVMKFTKTSMNFIKALQNDV
jgi:hypothetical protein